MTLIPSLLAALACSYSASSSTSASGTSVGVATTGVAAVGGAGVAAPDTSLEGTFRWIDVDGRPAPADFPAGSGAALVDGTLELRDAAAARAGAGGIGVRPQQRLVELPRLGLRRGVQLVLERVHARLVLAERRATPPGLRVEAHEGPVHGLRRRVHAQQADRRADGRLAGVDPDLVREQPRQAVEGQLAQYGWPGNVRELKNVVQRAFILAETDLVRPDLDLLRTARPVAETASTITFAVGTPLEEIERRMLFKTLAFFDNNKARTAEALGVTTKTIYNRLAHYQSQARARETDDGDQDNRSG